MEGGDGAHEPDADRAGSGCGEPGHLYLGPLLFRFGSIPTIGCHETPDKRIDVYIYDFGSTVGARVIRTVRCLPGTDYADFGPLTPGVYEVAAVDEIGSVAGAGRLRGTCPASPYGVTRCGAPTVDLPGCDIRVLPLLFHCDPSRHADCDE